MLFRHKLKSLKDNHLFYELFKAFLRLCLWRQQDIRGLGLFIYNSDDCTKGWNIQTLSCIYTLSMTYREGENVISIPLPVYVTQERLAVTGLLKNISLYVWQIIKYTWRDKNFIKIWLLSSKKKWFYLLQWELF